MKCRISDFQLLLTQSGSFETSSPTHQTTTFFIPKLWLNIVIRLNIHVAETKVGEWTLENGCPSQYVLGQQAFNLQLLSLTCLLVQNMLKAVYTLLGYQLQIELFKEEGRHSLLQMSIHERHLLDRSHHLFCSVLSSFVALILISGQMDKVFVCNFYR